MRKFEKRKQKGKILENQFIEFLEANGYKYIKTGYEHLQAASESLGRIKKNKDRTSAFIRHYPDISLILDGVSCLFEVKNSSGIERECYNNYLSLKKNLGLNVVLLLRECRQTKSGRFVFIEDLKFIEMDNIDRKTGYRIPVDEGVWRCARKLPAEEYHGYLSAMNYKTSGCDFAFIDFRNTKKYKFDEVINVIKKPVFFNA